MTNEELLKKIEEAKASGATELYLGGMGITILPSEIFQLPKLTTLHLSGNQLSSLPPEIGQLTNLTKLYIWNNQLSSLPPEIGQLTNLTELDLSGNQLTTLPPEICQLTNMESLILCGNPFISPPPEITITRNGIKSIRQYFAELEKSKRTLNDVVKTVLLYDVVKRMLHTEGEPYSPEADTKIKAFSADYREQLVLEAAQVAERDDVQQISCIHVEEAKKRLRSIERRNRTKKLCGHLSGVLLGVGLSTLVPVLSNISQASTLILTIGILSSIIGTVFLMYDTLT